MRQWGVGTEGRRDGAMRDKGGHHRSLFQPGGLEKGARVKMHLCFPRGQAARGWCHSGGEAQKEQQAGAGRKGRRAYGFLLTLIAMEVPVGCPGRRRPDDQVWSGRESSGVEAEV